MDVATIFLVLFVVALAYCVWKRIIVGAILALFAIAIMLGVVL